MAANDAIDAVRKLTAFYKNFIGHRVTYYPYPIRSRRNS